MNVLIPTADYPPIEGGIASVALHVSRELAGLGHRVTVVAPYFPDMDAFDAAEPVQVVRYRGYGWGWFRFFPMAWAARPHRQAADLVLGINVSYGGVLGWLWKKPYVTFAYAYEFLKFLHTPVLGGLLRRVYAEANQVVAVSRFTADQLFRFGVDPSRISVILPGAPPAQPLVPEGLDLVRQRYGLKTPRLILAVGRLIPRKGHRTLVQALPKILTRFPDAQLVIVGRGPCEAEVRRATEELGLADKVVFTGRVSDDDLAGLYQLCEVFALPTGQDDLGQVEGFGLVFAEAHAYGKPVVAGRSGGTIEAVIDQETGLLVDPDDPEALAGAIAALLEDPARARELGAQGRRRVETELNWAHFTRRVLETAGFPS